MLRTLLVASAGGHVDELMIHSQRLGIDEEGAVWVTSPTVQTETLLAGREVIWVPRVGSAEFSKAARSVLRALRVYRRVKPDLVVSTGALIAIPYIFTASVAGCETWFIESATRVAGPSKTGKFARRFSRAKLFAQGDGWGDPAWELVPSVFDAFESCEIQDRGLPNTPRVTVTLGTEHWPYPRAIERVRELLHGASITWQVGTTEYAVDGENLRQWVPADELRASIRDSDLVVMHAGVGSVLVALNEGKVPVILPRRAFHGEMVDDHQTEIAALLAKRNLAISVDPDDLDASHLERAARMTARRHPEFGENSGSS